MRIRLCCLILLFMATLIESSEKKKVLIYNPFLGYYHTTFMTTIANELHDAGYEVYMLDSLVNTELNKNDRKVYHEIITVPQNEITRKILEKGEKSEKGLMAFWDDLPTVDKYVGFFTFFKRKSGFSRMMYHQCKDVLTRIYKWKDVEFDLGITEFFDFCGVGIFSLLKVSKTMLASSVPLHEHLGEKLGLPKSFKIPTKFSMSTLPELREGFEELGVRSIIENGVQSAIIAHETFGHMEKYQTALFREKNSSFDFQVLLRSAHSLIENVHPLIDLNKPAPQIIRIGGITVRNATLDQDEEKETTEIFKAIDDAVKRGQKIVLVSFGTVMNTKTMKQNTVDNFIKALEQVEAFFIWKTDREASEKLPENVKASKWLPQNNILSSGKVDLFVSHMGIGSMTEAAYAGVPLLSIPIFVDQHYNYACARRLGIARFVDKTSLAETSSHLKDAIEKALKDEELKAKSKELKNTLEKSVDQKRRMLDHIELILSRSTDDNSMTFQNQTHHDGLDLFLLSIRSLTLLIQYGTLLFPLCFVAVFRLLSTCCAALCYRYFKDVDLSPAYVLWWFCSFISNCLFVAWPFHIASHIPYFVYFLYESLHKIIVTLAVVSFLSYFIPMHPRYDIHRFLGAFLALTVIACYYRNGPWPENDDEEW